MRKQIRWFFWLEMMLSCITCVLFVLTQVERTWVELLLHIDPDRGNGSLEWLIVSGLLVVTLVLFSLAGYEWRRARLASGLS